MSAIFIFIVIIFLYLVCIIFFFLRACDGVLAFSVVSVTFPLHAFEDGKGVYDVKHQWRLFVGMLPQDAADCLCYRRHRRRHDQRIQPRHVHRFAEGVVIAENARAPV